MSVQREELLSRLQTTSHDVLVIGGGINGAVAASALAAHGASVALVDRGDFASMTSQESSNMIWGGIKYLENFEFSLVRGLCRSRNQLMKSYPSRVREIRFLACIQGGSFKHSRIPLYSGTWFYWLMGGGKTNTPSWHSKGGLARLYPQLNADVITGGVEYSDAYLPDNDSRFVFHFIKDAMNAGATALNYVDITSFKREADGLWHCKARDVITSRDFVIHCRCLVNACGPLADCFNRDNGISTRSRIVLSKGVHLIVNRLVDREVVLTFFADDGRFFFVLPMGDRSCVGTTDTRVENCNIHVDDVDRQFILDQVNKHLRLNLPLAAQDIIAERCGVRPLVTSSPGTDNSHWLDLSRRHVIETDSALNHVSIYGGKLTDCINIGNEILSCVQPMLGKPDKGTGKPWFGEPVESDRYLFMKAFMSRAAHLWPDDERAKLAGERLWRRYGRPANDILKQVEADPHMATELIPGTGFLRAEAHYARDHEMIVCLADLLRRRTSIALLRRKEELAGTPGLLELCDILFGKNGMRQHDKYFNP